MDQIEWPVVCVVNRTSHPLRATKDGKHHIFQPGDNWVTADWVRFVKAQNIIPGTKNYSTLQVMYLVGVKGTQDDLSPIPDEVLAAMPNEALDRTELPAWRQRVTNQTSNFPRGRQVAQESLTPGIYDPGKFGGEG